MPQGKLGDINPGAFILDYGDSPHENIEIRPTLGTLQINIEEGISDVFEEEFGDAPVDTVSKGTVITIDAPFTRLDGWHLSQIFPNKFEVQSADELIIKNCAGYSYFENSIPAVIRPLVCNELVTDRSEWVYFWHVHPVMNFQLGYDRENQRMYSVQFKVYPVQTVVRRGQLCKWGV